MKVDVILAEIEKVAKELGIRVSYEALGGELGAGGLCKVKGEWRVIIDKRSTPGERLSLLGQALTRFPLEGVTLSQAAAEVIEKSRPLSARVQSGSPGSSSPPPSTTPEG